MVRRLVLADLMFDVSVVSVVSVAVYWLLVILKCVLTTCVRESVAQRKVGSVRNQCSSCGVHHFCEKLSVTQPYMAAGSFQGWQS